ncbi:MAG: dipicolinate synthase [Lachnospiraceae bacterium]|nr:dipicolinate synthase [Lachnospiraceae bacterium]
MKKFDIAIVGGDRRIACMSYVFAQKGYDVICYGTAKQHTDDLIYHTLSLQEAIAKAPVIICGIPFQKDECLYFETELTKVPLTELQRLLRKSHTIFGGIIPDDFKRICEKRNIAYYDFMQEESLSILNAVATAEGAILEALMHKNTQLHQSKILLLGYGRCGKILADKLKGLSSHVTVCSNVSTELALASSFGFQTLNLSCIEQEIHRFEYLFNTIPATVLPKSCLKKTAADALIIDIASNQVGVDYAAAQTLNRNVLFCPGLPGKYASLSCAQQLSEYVLSKI